MFEILLLFAVIIVVLLFLFYFYKRSLSLERQLNETLFSKSSLSTKYGRLTEQLMPLSEKFPFDSKNFRFIGSPIDGIAFESDKIYFCEFKGTSAAQLSEKQKNIKELVKEKKIEWLELKAE